MQTTPTTMNWAYGTHRIAEVPVDINDLLNAHAEALNVWNQQPACVHFNLGFSVQLQDTVDGPTAFFKRDTPGFSHDVKEAFKLAGATRFFETGREISFDPELQQWCIRNAPTDTVLFLGDNVTAAIGHAIAELHGIQNPQGWGLA